MRAETKRRLKELGYKSYTAYLRSPHWRERRKKFYKDNPFKKKCWICGSKASLTLHHVTYERVGAERDEDFVVLCSPHHRGTHSYMKRHRTKLEIAHYKYKEALLEQGVALLGGGVKRKPRKKKRKSK